LDRKTRHSPAMRNPGASLKHLLVRLLVPLRSQSGQQQVPSSFDYCCDNISGIKSRPRATEPKRACHSEYAKLTAKVYEIDSMICARCGSEMRLVAVITDPAEVRKILRHLLRIGRAPPRLDPSALN
jgi:hypothetical protein